MKYYRRSYTWLKLDAENRKIEALGDSPWTKSITQHNASMDGEKFDSFVGSIDKDLIVVPDYNAYLAENPTTTKCIEIPEQEFVQKKQSIIQSFNN